jgi:hypothetical protein
VAAPSVAVKGFVVDQSPIMMDFEQEKRPISGGRPTTGRWAAPLVMPLHAAP